jgi:hypothetical protein
MSSVSSRLLRGLFSGVVATTPASGVVSTVPVGAVLTTLGEGVLACGLCMLDVQPKRVMNDKLIRNEPTEQRIEFSPTRLKKS